MVISKNLYRVIFLLKCVTLKKYTLLYISITISLKMPISYFSILECSVFVVVMKIGVTSHLSVEQTNKHFTKI